MMNYRMVRVLGAMSLIFSLNGTFAEARDLTPPFALSQRAPQLSDLWQSKGHSDSSQLCATTAIANTMYYLKHYRNPPITGLKTPYDQDGGGHTSKYDLVRYFVDLCGTIRDEGTNVNDMSLCLQTYFAHSRVNASVRTITRWNVGYMHESHTRAITTRDLRDAIDRQYPVIAAIAWYVQRNGIWKPAGGHVVTIYGYDEASETTVMVTDPWRSYPNSSGHYSDRVKLSRIPGSQRESLGGHDWELVAPQYNQNGVRAVLSMISIPMPSVSRDSPRGR
jgi:hypothetical protein